MIRDYARLAGERVLDIGCGIGSYVEKLQALDAQAFGIDVDLDKLLFARCNKGLDSVVLSPSEMIAFPNNTFDLVLLHEVIEHVRDDRETIRESARITRPGGLIIVFAPNRLFPFETHGAYFGQRYVFGNIPLIGYLPDSVRQRFAPHVRAYRSAQLRSLFEDLPGRILVHSQVYPGYDKIAKGHANAARLLRGVTYSLENTPLRAFGLSHFLVWRKN